MKLKFTKQEINYIGFAICFFMFMILSFVVISASSISIIARAVIAAFLFLISLVYLVLAGQEETNYYVLYGHKNGVIINRKKRR